MQCHQEPIYPHGLWAATLPFEYPAQSSTQSVKFKMAASMVKFVHRATLCRLLRPTAILGQFYSTESSPSVVGKQDKALEVVEEDAKVNKRIKSVKLKLNLGIYDEFDQCRRLVPQESRTMIPLPRETIFNNNISQVGSVYFYLRRTESKEETTIVI